MSARTGTRCTVCHVKKERVAETRDEFYASLVRWSIVTIALTAVLGLSLGLTSVLASSWGRVVCIPTMVFGVWAFIKTHRATWTSETP